eukprot:758770-Hanusia_phi.AAC.3
MGSEDEAAEAAGGPLSNERYDVAVPSICLPVSLDKCWAYPPREALLDVGVCSKDDTAPSVGSAAGKEAAPHHPVRHPVHEVVGGVCAVDVEAGGAVGAGEQLAHKRLHALSDPGDVGDHE